MNEKDGMVTDLNEATVGKSLGKNISQFRLRWCVGAGSQYVDIAVAQGINDGGLAEIQQMTDQVENVRQGQISIGCQSLKTLQRTCQTDESLQSRRWTLHRLKWIQFQKSYDK